MRYPLRISRLLLVAALAVLSTCTRKLPPEEPLPVEDEKRLEQAHIQAITDPGLRTAVVRRDSFLTQQEVIRTQFLDRLEFFPVRPPLFPCYLPTPTLRIDPHRSLFVHDRATLDARDFTLRRTLTQIATQVSSLVPGTTAASIFRQFWDTQNPAPGLVPISAHCTDNGGTLNGFPNSCRPAEGAEAQGPDPVIMLRMKDYRALALVNRLDLAHQGWRNCGEHRIVYGKQVGSRKNLIIFEAVLPNPRPGCREGCIPVANFWRNLSTIANPATRAGLLEQFYYNGLPGFRPVVHVDHYNATGISTGYGSSGSGQIRTNQFLQQPWTLKEFKTLIDCGSTPCAFQIVPVMVKANPFGTLWNEDVALNTADPMQARAQDFEADVLLQVANLASASLLGITYGVDLDHDAAESISQAPAVMDHYRDQMNAAAATLFRGSLGAGALTADQMANRALTQSCAGCHMPSTFGLLTPNSIGSATLPAGGSTDQWPDALAFVHVDTPTLPLPELASPIFGTGQGQPISPALKDVFLVDRKDFLLKQLNAPRCPCKNRFRFVPPSNRPRAIDIQDRIDKGIEAKLDELQAQLKSAESDSAKAVATQSEIDRLLVDRDRQLEAELKKAGVAVPADDAPDLKPRALQLEASKLAGADERRAGELRTAEVLRLIKQEPPRRTVTGSFRVH